MDDHVTFYWQVLQGTQLMTYKHNPTVFHCLTSSCPTHNVKKRTKFFHKCFVHAHTCCFSTAWRGVGTLLDWLFLLEQWLFLDKWPVVIATFGETTVIDTLTCLNRLHQQSGSNLCYNNNFITLKHRISHGFIIEFLYLGHWAQSTPAAFAPQLHSHVQGASHESVFVV